MNDLIPISEKSSSVFYRLSVRSFFDSDGDGIGDLRGVMAKLPYFLFLGVDSIILFDVIDSDRYGVTDYLHVDPATGSMTDLEELVAAMHEIGLKVYLSFSPLNTSVAHPWFEKSAASSDLNPYREYYIWKQGKNGKNKISPDGRKTSSKESVWRYEKNGYWYYADLGEKRPTLNYDNPRVRKEMIEVIRFWKGAGLDGFVIQDARLKTREGMAIEQGQYYGNYEEVLEAGAPLIRLLKECADKFQGKIPLFADFADCDPSMEPVLLEGEIPLLTALLSSRPSEESKNRSFSMSRFLKKYLSLQLEAKADSGVIGISFGSASCDRLLSKVSDEKNLMPAAKMLGALLSLGAAFPVVYQGEEIGMTDLPKKIAQKESSTDHPGALEPFQWDAKANAGFTEAPFPYLPVNRNYREINCAAEATDANSALSFYRKLIALRRSSNAFCTGTFTDCSSDALIAFLRTTPEEELLVIVNTSSKNVSYTVSSDLTRRAANCLLSSYPLVGKTLHPSISLRPFEVRVYRYES